MATNVQVYQEPDGSSWSVRVVGEEETEPKLFASRDEAVQEGRRLAEERGGELLIHDESGETEARERPASRD